MVVGKGAEETEDDETLVVIQVLDIISKEDDLPPDSLDLRSKRYETQPKYICFELDSCIH